MDFRPSPGGSDVILRLQNWRLWEYEFDQSCPVFHAIYVPATRRKVGIPGLLDDTDKMP